MSLNKAAKWLQKKYPLWYPDKAAARAEVLDSILSASGWKSHVYERLAPTLFMIDGKTFNLSPSDLEEIDRIDMQILLLNS